MSQPNDGTRMLRAYTGMLVLSGIVLVFFVPALALVAFSAAGMFALYVWLLGRRIDELDARWTDRQTQRRELVDGLEADGTITYAEGEARRSSDGGLRHPMELTESIEAVRRLGNRRLWIAGALLVFSGFGLIFVSTVLGVSVMVVGLGLMLWAMFGDPDTQAMIRRQVERTVSLPLDPTGQWVAAAADLRALRGAHDEGQISDAEYGSRHRQLLDRFG
jgi:hypothetical protein